MQKDFQEELINLFNKYLIFCLKDYKLDKNEINSLRHLGRILLLDQIGIEDLIQKQTSKIYGEQLSEALSDNRLDKVEKEKLKTIQEELILTDSITKSIYQEQASKIIYNFIEDNVEDGSLSPDEDAEIEKLAKGLGVNLDFDDKSKKILDRYRLYWQIENGDIPTIEADIKIQKSEKLYFKVDVNWMEQRKVTKRINYAGPTARIKICKGFYYRMGSLNVNRISEDVWKLIDSGTVYLTNKRLIFMGSKGNKMIRLNKILAIKPFENGVDIQKDIGRSPFLEFSQNVDLFSMILARLLNEI